MGLDGVSPNLCFVSNCGDVDYDEQCDASNVALAATVENCGVIGIACKFVWCLGD